MSVRLVQPERTTGDREDGGLRANEDPWSCRLMLLLQSQQSSHLSGRWNLKMGK
jgi:hypothetical protein